MSKKTPAALRPLSMRPLTAIRHLRKVDPELARAMDAVGPFRLDTAPGGLAQIAVDIIGQQLSTTVAATIAGRFVELLGGRGKVTPRAILNLSDDQLRAAGLSRAKMHAVRDLAEFWRRERLTTEKLSVLPDDEFIGLLTRVRGIGPWTAKMYLIFTLRRPDVLPHEDLGLRAGIRKIDGLVDMPSSRHVVERCEAWRPWSTVATCYAWRYLAV